MSVPTASRERTLGRTILGNDLLREALEAFAEADRRTVPNAVGFLLHRVLLQGGWLVMTPAGYVPGPHLLSFRERSTPCGAELARVVPLARPM